MKIENATSFNKFLKNEIAEITNQKVKVRIVNSYKYPNCYVEVYNENGFTNDFKLMAFDTLGHSRDNLLNNENISYGNIQSNHISLKVIQWELLINNQNETLKQQEQ